MKTLSSDQLVGSLNKTADRYNKLQAVFDEFCANSAALATNSQVHGVQHRVDKVRGRLEVGFCGNVYWFDFSVKNEKGLVTCTVHKWGSQTDTANVGAFTFNSNGDTDVQGPEDALSMNTTGDASQLVLHLIFQDVNKSAKAGA